MDTLMTILTEPHGMWESILGAFKGTMGSYILAVILLAVIVRVVFAVVDVVNKRFTTKNMQINQKMQPELEAIQKKYGHDKVLLQKKQQEIYKKYQFNMVSSCLPMLVAMILQLVVFLTLWTGLQNVSYYNIAKSYENTKTVYYNVLLLNENTELKTKVEEFLASDKEVDYSNFSVEIDLENLNMSVQFKDENGTEIYNENITIIPTSGEEEGDKGVSNKEVYKVIERYAMDKTIVSPLSAEEGKLSEYNLVIKNLAEEVTADFYTENLESFLWIKNIYKAESPATTPVFDKSEIVSYLQRYYNDAEKEAEEIHDYEGQIFDYVVEGLNRRDLGANGYYILVILAVATSFLSIFINNKLTKKTTGTQSGGKMMYFIMPLILGLFTLMYTSLFAIYIIVGQIVMIALSPLTNLIVKKWIEASDRKKEKKKQEVIDVDYRRKDM
mgnify:CR=1 FL=1